MNMTNIDEIKEAITHLSEDDLLDLRRWFDELDAQVWDLKIEDDVAAGKLDTLADEAVAAARAGRITEL
jgi:hypothetical protein